MRVLFFAVDSPHVRSVLAVCDKAPQEKILLNQRYVDTTEVTSPFQGKDIAPIYVTTLASNYTALTR
jgi:hypothetical protein